MRNGGYGSLPLPAREGNADTGRGAGAPPQGGGRGLRVATAPCTGGNAGTREGRYRSLHGWQCWHEGGELPLPAREGNADTGRGAGAPPQGGGRGLRVATAPCTGGNAGTREGRYRSLHGWQCWHEGGELPLPAREGNADMGAISLI